MNDLPRQTYLTPEDEAAEQEIAELFAFYRQRKQLKIGVDDPNAEKPRVDRALVRDNRITAFFEVKRCLKYTLADAPDWTVSTKKVGYLCDLHHIMRVPCLFVVRFNCGAIVYLDPVDEPHMTVRDWGRTDRGDPGDVETGARYRIGQFRGA